MDLQTQTDESFDSHILNMTMTDLESELSSSTNNLLPIMNQTVIENSPCEYSHIEKRFPSKLVTNSPQESSLSQRSVTRDANVTFIKLQSTQKSTTSDMSRHDLDNPLSRPNEVTLNESLVGDNSNQDRLT